MTRQITRLQEQLEAAKDGINELNDEVAVANARSDKTHKHLLLTTEKVIKNVLISSVDTITSSVILYNDNKYYNI